MYVRGRRCGYMEGTAQRNSGHEINHKKQEHEQQQNAQAGLSPPSLAQKHTYPPFIKELVEETASTSDDEELYRQIEKRLKFNVNQYSVMRRDLKGPHRRTNANRRKWKSYPLE